MQYGSWVGGGEVERANMASHNMSLKPILYQVLGKILDSVVIG